MYVAHLVLLVEWLEVRQVLGDYCKGVGLTQQLAELV